MNKEHHYALKIEWTGNLGTGTSDYRSYTRNHIISAENKPDIQGSSDPHFRGDKTRYNPEEMLVAALSTCHMLSYLHLCAVNKVIVLEYNDNATGTMVENPDGSGQLTETTLNPVVKVKDSSMNAKALELHEQAEKLCFIARSVNFPVHHKPTIIN
ncbi:MAG TPA: OsmC family protein [Cyclobacteriaceae bacterium]|jgi:organic hydroperoxide reductase OsmC/OhrA|nr:OsmC family protein [Cyclobacteriaceae bacterium]